MTITITYLGGFNPPEVMTISNGDQILKITMEFLLWIMRTY